jgi:alkylation response protein AidB-like acyl-CoA dehydrogenase
MAIARFGSSAQKAAHLPGFAAGTHLLAYGNAGLRQVAPGFPVGCVVKTAAGDQLTGYWTGIAGGMQAHALLLSALDEAGETRLYIVPTAGLERTAQPGTSDETLAAVTLTDFAVTAEQELCGGEEALAQITELARLGNAAVMLGCAAEALKLTGEYAKTRHQFDVPIGTFQAVQQRAGDGYIDLAAIRSTFWQAAWRTANGETASREIAIAAFWAADGGHRIVSAAQHIHGGMGFDRDYPLHRNYLQFKQCEFALGGASALLAELGDLIAAPTSR